MAGLERGGDFTYLITGLISNGTIEIAVAHSNDSVARFGQRHPNGVDDLNSEDKCESQKDQCHANKDNSDPYDIAGFIVDKDLYVTL